MAYEHTMDIHDNNDTLILAALMKTEASIANEIGLLLLKKLRERMNAD